MNFERILIFTNFEQIFIFHNISRNSFFWHFSKITKIRFYQKSFKSNAKKCFCVKYSTQFKQFPANRSENACRVFFFTDRSRNPLALPPPAKCQQQFTNQTVTKMVKKSTRFRNLFNKHLKNVLRSLPATSRGEVCTKPHPFGDSKLCNLTPPFNTYQTETKLQNHYKSALIVKFCGECKTFDGFGKKNERNRLVGAPLTIRWRLLFFLQILQNHENAKTFKNIFLILQISNKNHANTEKFEKWSHFFD